MSATAVKRITPLETEPTNRVRRVLPPSVGFLVRWGLFVADWNWRRPLGCSWSCPKVAMDAAARLRWHILDLTLDQVGNLRRHIDRFGLLSMA